METKLFDHCQTGSTTSCFANRSALSFYEIMKRRKVILLGFLLLIIFCFAVFPRLDPLTSKHRIAWKNEAIISLIKRMDDPAWLNNERNRLQSIASKDTDESSGWLSSHLILMKNGDWLNFESISHKENPRIYDFFIAKGSDGHWYYSTYHFCKDNVALKMDDQSGSLPEFVKNYSLQSFDGKSDDCLKKTWPRSSSPNGTTN